MLMISTKDALAIFVSLFVGIAVSVVFGMLGWQIMALISILVTAGIANTACAYLDEIHMEQEIWGNNG